MERAEPSRIGARKSLRTSMRGHSATQKVAWTMPSTRTSDQLSSMAIGQWSCAGGADGRVRLVGAQELMGQVVG